MHGLGIAFLPFLLVLGLVYLFFGIRYKRSKKFRGRVIESKGTEIVYYGGRFCDEIYETYEVVYYYKGQPHQGEVCTSKKGLKPGASVDVYVYDPNGIHEIETDIYWRKFKLFAACSICMGIIMIVFILVIYRLPDRMNDRSNVSENHTYSSVLTDEEIEQLKKQVIYDYDQ